MTAGVIQRRRSGLLVVSPTAPTPVSATSLRAASSSVVATLSSLRTARAFFRESKTRGTGSER